MLFCMTIASIQQQLSTPEGFAKAVSAKSAVFGGAVTSLVLGVLGLGINLFQLGSASDWTWSLIGRFFFDAQAVEFQGSGAGRASVWRFFYVYGPLVLVPLAIVLFIVHFSTRRKAGAQLFADFQERGWVGRQRFTGLKVQEGRNQVDVALISHPSVPDETFDAATQRFAAQIGSLDKKALKAANVAAAKAGVMNGVSASALSPELPAELLAAPAQGSGEFAAIIPAAPGGKAKLRMLPIKG